MRHATTQALPDTDPFEQAMLRWKEKAVSILLFTLVVAGLPAIGATLFNAIRHTHMAFLEWLYLSIYLATIGLSLAPKLDFRLKAWGIVVLASIGTAASFSRLGLVGNGRLWLLATPIIAAILLGSSAGYAVSGLSVFTFSVFVVLVHIGILEHSLTVKVNPLTLDYWVEGGVGLLLVIIAVVVLVERYQVLHMRTLSSSRKTNEALRNAEAKYRSIFENAIEGIFQSSLEGVFISANPALAQIYGYDTPEQLISSLTDIGRQLYAHSNRREEFIRQLRETGVVKAFETEIIRKDGTKAFTSVHARAVRDDDGKILYFEGTVEDITQRKKAETALKESEERYRSLVENLPIGIYRCTPGAKGRFLMANRAFLSTFGYGSEAELTEANVSDIYADPSERKAFSDSVLSEKSLRMTDRRLKKKDGTPVWGRVTARVSYVEETQDAAHFDCAIEDITERKVTEEALRESEERFRLLVESIPQGVALMGKDGIYKYLNPKFVELFGYALEDVPVGREWFRKAYPDPEYRKEVISLWKKDCLRERPAMIQPRVFQVTCRGGTQKAIRFWSVMMKTGDFLVTYEDMTEQKRLESQLQHAQKMEAIGTLAGGIAHDFNNLLMGIQGRASLMLLEMEPSHPLHGHLKGIEEYVKSAAELTKRLLGFARGGKYEVKSTDLNEIITRTSEMFGHTRKEIRIHRKLQPDLWTVEVDRSQIEQVLINLYVNAWQAMPAGGDLLLQTENVLITEEETGRFDMIDGKYVKTSVTDTGMGMDEATRLRVFDPFFTTKEIGRGTGLGLASAYGIMKNHGGMIRVESEKGKGAAFILYLPASQQRVQEEEPSAGESLKGSETILLVDDEEMVLDVAAQLLKRLGYEVLAVRSGREAIEVYQEAHQRISMVVLDMIMPETGGGETFDRLKEIDPHVKVLLSSGYSIDGQATNILQRGCKGFIQKPFDMNSLSRKIREILGR